MKRLLQVVFLLWATHAAAQSDFSNDYLVTISGSADYNGDLSENDGSRIDMWLTYQNGEQTHVLQDRHGGGVHYFFIELLVKSTNKIIRIDTYGRAYEQGGFLEDSDYKGEGYDRILLDTTSVYPCHKKTYLGKFPIYQANSPLHLSIQPLTSVSAKITTTATWYNNSNEDVSGNICGDYGENVPMSNIKGNYRYQCIATSRDGSAVVLGGGELNNFNPGAGVSAQGTRWYANANDLASLRVTSSFTVYVDLRALEFEYPRWCMKFQNLSTSNTFPLGNHTVEDTVVLGGIQVHPNAAPGGIVVSPERYTIPLKYGGSNNILPYDPANSIVILGPRGNPASFYHWVYSTDGTNWVNLPARFQGKHRLNISGYDLLGKDFYKYHHKNFFFKLLVDCTGGESAILTLSGRMSAPNILSVLPLPDSCYATPRRGAFVVTFDRALLNENGEQETLMITARDISNANPPAQIQNIVLDAANSFTWPRGLESDRTYEISLLGSYLGSFTYSDNKKNHYDTMLLVRPAPVTSTITPQAVNCYNGGDGRFTLDANGGVGHYTFAYVLAGTTDSVKVGLGNDTIYTASFLRRATYAVYLKDGNGCGDAGGVKSIVINQPATPVSIAYTHTTDPRGFGYTDGYIETIVSGGTPAVDNTYNIEWFDPVNLLPADLYNNRPLAQGFQANLDSVGDGYYQLKAYDSRYALAHPDHRAGCIVVSDSFRLIQPPPLVIVIREHHFVTCNGNADGQIAAHATGGVPLQGGLPYTFAWFKAQQDGDVPLQQFDSIAGQLKAGLYRVRIIDKNNVSKLSEIFALTQPDVLQTQIVTTPVSCTSGIDGTAVAPVTGGTAPYQYLWSYNDNTTPAMSQLGEGLYFVLVTDVRGCSATAAGRVNTPVLLHVDSTLQNPQCEGYANGRIALAVTEGSAPYRYEWSNGAVTEDIENLTAGTYTVTITDNNNCRTFRSYNLTDPQPVRVALGGLRYLCNGQSYVADATIAGGATYAWSGANGFSAGTPVVTIDREGSYRVDVVTQDGCRGSDAITLKRVAEDVSSEFVVTTQAFVGEEVTMLNLSNPQPDSVQWSLEGPAALSFASQEMKRAALIFPTEGVYTLLLKAYRFGCEAVSSKTITVLSGAFTDDGKNDPPFVTDFSVSPNPASDVFQVVVSMQEVATVRLRMISVATNAVIDDRQAHNESQYALSYNVPGLAAGTYLLLLETPKGSALLKVMVY